MVKKRKKNIKVLVQRNYISNDYLAPNNSHAPKAQTIEVAGLIKVSMASGPTTTWSGSMKMLLMRFWEKYLFRSRIFALAFVPINFIMLPAIVKMLPIKFVTIRATCFARKSIHWQQLHCPRSIKPRRNLHQRLN